MLREISTHRHRRAADKFSTRDYYSFSVLNAGQDDSSATDGAAASAETSSATAGNGRKPALRLRVVATLLGLVGTVLALSVPFLPVNTQITTLKWPTAEGTKPVSAPLVNYSPVWLDTHVPCAAAQSLDARTAGPAVLLSTNPPNSEYGKLTALTMQVDRGQLTLLSKGQQLATTPLPSSDCSISVHSDASGITADVGGKQLPIGRTDRPQLTGIYSQLDSNLDNTQGLSVQTRVDNRFESSASHLKLAAIVLAGLAFVGSIICLRRLDTRAGRRPPRLAPAGWWKPTLRDIAVFAALGIWWLIGAMTSDDGYILTIARARESAGYISNYFRWFANPESPFGWFYELYSLWVQVSTATPWVRLPALIMGAVSWLLISREVLPRLGQQVRRSHAAGWAAAAVFLAFWMPYNNGLRPEPVVVLFSLLAMCAVERAVATRRLMPAALGLVVAALALAANPHGMMSVTPYIAALKPLVRLVRQRAREYGWLPVLAPISASGFVILAVIFWDQTWQTVVDATQLKTQYGPSQDWYEEFSRYVLLFSKTADGALTRRFPVLLVLLCLVTCVLMLLRKGNIRGAALGPSRRLLGVTVLTFVALVLTPTKWTHHFGIFAAVGGALAALTALATSGGVLRSKRNRAGFFAGLMVVLAFSATGPNAWWYVSGWGVPWYNEAPTVDGKSVSTLLLIVAGIAGLVAVVEHLRLDEHQPDVGKARQKSTPLTAWEKRSRALRLGTAPLSIICALLVVGELGIFAKAIEQRGNKYSLGMDNVRQIAGTSRGLSDYIYVESAPKQGMLTVSSDQPSGAAPGTDDVPVPPKQNLDQENPDEYLRAKLQGFNRDGMPPGNGMDPETPDWKPPHQFGGDDAPVWGSYDQQGTSTGELRTQWYDLPQRAISGEVPVVLSLAGMDNSLQVEFGRDTPQGFQVMDRRPVRTTRGVAPQWRESRITVDSRAEGATKMRVVGRDQVLGPKGWVAVSAPRAPQLTNMTDYIGDAPTFVEWPAALVHPHLQIPSLHNGIAELPRFRVQAGADLAASGQGWSSPDSGGPFGWLNVTTSMRELPTYLRNDIHRDWGKLYAVDPYVPDALPPEAATEVHTETHWGTWSPGPLSSALQLPGDVPNSNDRNDVRTEPVTNGTGDQPEP